MTQLAAQPLPPATATTTPVPAKSDFEKLMERDFVTPRMAENAAEMREFDQRMRKARVYAESDVVPMHYRGKTNNCYIAIEIAERLKVSELMVMQNTYVHKGKLGFQGQFAIAVMNSSGVFEEPIDFEIECDDADGTPQDPTYRMRAVATRKGKKRSIKGPWVDWSMINGEGWANAKGENAVASKWMTLTDMMFRYRCAAFFGRTVCPELLMGFQTVEELEDTYGPGEGEPLPKRNGETKRKSLADMTTPPDGATAPANVPSSTPQGPAPENEPQAQAGPSSETTATGTTGEAREKPAGAVDAQAASTPPKVSGRPKAKQERDHEPSMGVKEAEDVPPETIADAFAKESDLVTLKNWMMKLAPKVRQSALETAGITTLVDAKEEDVRNAAYSAKLWALNNPK